MQPNAHKDLREDATWLSPQPGRGGSSDDLTFAEEIRALKYLRQGSRNALIKDRQERLKADVLATFPPIIGTTCELQTRSRCVFATVRHRTVRMKGALSQDTARLMVFRNW